MKEKKEVKIPSIYLYIHNIIQINFGRYASLKEVTDFMHEWRIPRVMRIAVAQELENMGLIRRKDRNNIEINESKIKLNTTNELYEYVGLLPNN